MLPQAFDIIKSDEIFALLSAWAQENNTASPPRNLVRAIFGNSPFLATLAQRYLSDAVRYLSGDIDTAWQSIIQTLETPRPIEEDDTGFMAFLREQKNRTAMLIACADISGKWPLEKVTSALSMFACQCVKLATNKALLNQIKKGEIAWPQWLDVNSKYVPFNLSKDSGFFILGMGKLGGSELNYSSDIDLIALYDPHDVDYIGRKTLPDCYVQMTRDIVRYIDQRTMHGYVFRVDLRLRPDPSATPVAINVEAAKNYYHSAAVNWERAAMIKAVCIAGDEKAGKQYLDEMSGWVWRKNMDYEALKDIAAIKNQINRHYDTERTVFRGYDVKLGVGGIREIEFFAQVNQLLHAGRHPTLRLKNTIDTLRELTALSLISQTTAAQLSAAYKYLRTVEHRIQMLRDKQTHKIPAESDELDRLKVFLGYDTVASFKQALSYHTGIVSAAYDSLLPDENKNEIPSIMPHANITLMLQENAFKNTEAALAIIETWQHGRLRSLRSNRARTLLNECLPALLTALSEARSPDNALVRFDRFLAQLPAGVQLFSLLKSNPALFRLLARIMSLAPALASILAKSPGLWDAVLDSHFFAPITDGDEMLQELILLLVNARDFQDVLDIVRRFVAEQKFRAGVQLLENIADAKEIGEALSLVTDYTLRQLIPIVEAEFANKHGVFENSHSGIAVVALGKYGGAELTHTSDLDIIFLYDCASNDDLSNGPKPLMPNVYYARLAQHILTAITALTPEGQLFEVDTRLRPSGSQGPLAVTVSTFDDYYQNSAWTWEFLALTRARTIHADAIIRQKIEAAIASVGQSCLQKKDIQNDTRDMRQKLRDQFDTKNPWEVKHSKGGLVDIEFICQYLMLQHADKSPRIWYANTLTAITALGGAGLLTASQAESLAKSYTLQQHIQSLLRLCLSQIPKSDRYIPIGLRETLAKATNHDSIQATLRTLKTVQSQSHKIYQAILEVAQ